MNMLNTQDDEPLIEQVALVAASVAVGRFVEVYSSLPKVGLTYLPAALRREAFSIATLEGLSPRLDNLARILGNRELTNMERGTRLAADIFDALSMIADLNGNIPDVATITEIFMTSDRSVGRMKRADFLWTIEEDAIWLHQELTSFDDAQNVWSAMELLRSIWSSGRFAATSRRMALIFSPWVLARAFGCKCPIIGAAGAVRQQPERFRDAGASRDLWAASFAQAIADGVAHEVGNMKEVGATRTSLLALCPPGRSSSSIGDAVDYMIGNPVFSAKHLAKVLNLTDRGAKVVLDRLVDANVLEIEGGLRNRMFVCRRTL